MSDFAQSVKQQADIVKVIEGYIRLRKAGIDQLLRALPLPQGKVAVVLRPCGAAVLPLLRLRRFGRCVQLCGQDRERRLSRGGADCGRQMRHSAAQARVLLAGRGRRSAAARQAPGAARDGNRLVRGAVARARRRRGARVPRWPGTDAGGHQGLPHRLRARQLQRPARPAERHGRRRDPAHQRPVQLEGAGRRSARGISTTASASG